MAVPAVALTMLADTVRRVKRKWMEHAPHAWWGDRLDARFLLADAMASLNGQRVLDVGCNGGILLSEVPETNCRVGVDVSPEALRVARALNPTASLLVADMLSLPFREAAFDVVVFAGMLEEFVPSRPKEAAVREIARVLRPGGALYMTTLNRRHWRNRDHPWKIFLTAEDIAALLSPHFEADIRGFNPFPPFPYFLPNRVLARLPGIWRLLVALMGRGIGTARA
ncbi:MAG: class I SAM-dependent methyltransferase, partial [Candidatus Rokubacteria bacterium]|nr:class I SAM-dependent methyltransferase [Candidatus Rokubacteria bacterium]